MPHRESPLKRRNPSGVVVWVARYTDRDGRRRSAGTFKLKRQAQDAIDAAYQTPRVAETVGAYLPVWLKRYPRSDRTDTTNAGRIRQVLPVRVEGRELRYWPLSDLRRKHAIELVDRMLVDQGRASAGAQNVLRSLSAMCEDAITDELCDVNPWKGVRVRESDKRVTKKRRPAHVFSWEQMHAVAATAGPYEPMLRTLCDCGLRVGELFALQRDGLDVAGALLTVTGSAYEGVVVGSSREKNHARTAPVPPGLLALLREIPPRIDSPWLFPTLSGKVWRYNNWRRAVWIPARDAAGLDITTRDMRHSYVTLLGAAGVDGADLAAIAGHSEQTQARYRHALNRSFDDVRRLVG
jgi:integrase